MDASFSYDANGSPKTWTRGGQTDQYIYDHENRLTSLTQGAHSYSYQYDYRTRRVARVEDGVSTQISFSGGASVRETSAGLNLHYIRGSDYGGGVGGILYSVRNGSLSFAHYNHRGDVTTRTGSDKAVTYQATYEAFGTRTQEDGASADRQRANTKEEDPTGLLNEGFRYRDLETGTFITRDPAGFVDGPNLYAYVRQNPWSKFDPEGLNSYPTSFPQAGWDPGMRALQNSSAYQTGYQRGMAVGAMAIGYVARDMIPLVGEYHDYADAMSAPEGSRQQAASYASMSLNVFAYGLLPNLAGVRSALRVVADSAEANVVTGTKRAVEQSAKATVETAAQLRAGEHTTYRDFDARSKVGDDLAGHELWQHANINEHGLAPTRLSTPAFQQNPVIVLDGATHKNVNAAQRELDARAMAPAENIKANAQILRDLKAADSDVINRAEKAALEHARDYGY